MTDTLFPIEDPAPPMRVPPGEHARGLARNTDPGTSHRAAARAGIAWRDRILAVLAEHGPLTDDEICRHIGAPERDWPSVKTARSRLANVGEPRVEKVPGEYRPSEKGSPQLLWRLTNEGNPE